MVPLSCGAFPATILSRVLLPLPLGPTIAFRSKPAPPRPTSRWGGRHLEVLCMTREIMSYMLGLTMQGTQFLIKDCTSTALQHQPVTAHYTEAQRAEQLLFAVMGLANALQGAAERVDGGYRSNDRLLEEQQPREAQPIPSSCQPMSDGVPQQPTKPSLCPNRNMLTSAMRSTSPRRLAFSGPAAKRRPRPAARQHPAPSHRLPTPRLNE